MPPLLCPTRWAIKLFPHFTTNVGVTQAQSWCCHCGSSTVASLPLMLLVVVVRLCVQTLTATCSCLCKLGTCLYFGTPLCFTLHTLGNHHSAITQKETNKTDLQRSHVPQFAIDVALEEGIAAGGSVLDGSAQSMLAPDLFALYALCPTTPGRLRVAVMHTRSTANFHFNGI